MSESQQGPLPACRRLLFPLLHAEKEIEDVCTQATGTRNFVTSLVESAIDCGLGENFSNTIRLKKNRRIAGFRS